MAGKRDDIGSAGEGQGKGRDLPPVTVCFSLLLRFSSVTDTVSYRSLSSSMKLLHIFLGSPE